MTPEEIFEGNQLLAEFMGYVNTTPADPDFNIYENSSGEMLEAMSMKYHSSWDWLMEVVQKIWGITNCSDSIFRFTVGYKTYIMLENNTGKHIEVCWNACLAFIKWYNQNKASEETKSCPNCKETKQPCACMRNICHKCGKPVGNITFTVCDECWDIEFPPKK